MNEILIYLLKSAAILTVLYTVYWLFLRKDTFFQVNRFYLVNSVVLSLIVPLLELRLWNESSVATAAILLDPVLITPDKIEKVAATHLSLFQVIGIVYLTGVAIFFLKFMVQIVQLLLIVRRCKITRQEGANLVFVDNGYSPFSFFNLIFIRKEYYVDGKLTPVVEHEKIHVRQLHTLDLILTEIAIIIQWFNPFAWLLGKSVKSVHEFLADEGVLKQGFLKTDYQTLILNEAMGLQLNNLTNNFNISLLKNRITMMTKSRSASWASLKAGFAFPALLAVLFLFTAGSLKTVTSQEVQQKKTAPVDNSTVFAAKAADPDSVYAVVKTMPEFPGGFDAMAKYLVANIKYPEESRKNGVQGTVFVTYVVEKDGKVNHVKILRGVNDECDLEALRVVKSMPDWTPGKNDKGEVVRVQFNLPIKFALDDKAKSTQAEEQK